MHDSVNKKLKESLSETQEVHLLSAWKKPLQSCLKYRDEFVKKCKEQEMNVDEASSR